MFDNNDEPNIASIFFGASLLVAVLFLFYEVSCMKTNIKILHKKIHKYEKLNKLNTLNRE